MRRAYKLFGLFIGMAFAGGASVAAGAAVEGSSPEMPTVLTVSTATNSIEVVYVEDHSDDGWGGADDGWGTEDDDGWGSPGGSSAITAAGVHYYRVNLEPGQDYTFWLENRKDNFIELEVRTISKGGGGWGPGAQYLGPWTDFPGADVNGYWRILAGDWDPKDTSVCSYSIEVTGGGYPAGTSVGRLYYVRAAVGIEEPVHGTSDQPDAVGEIGDTPVERSECKVVSEDSWYYLTCELKKGCRYELETLSGSAGGKALLEFQPIWGQSEEGWEISDVEFNKKGVIVPSADGTYQFRLSRENPVADMVLGVRITKTQSRLPEDHELQPQDLVPGVRQTCRPGYTVRPDLPYYDAVIDEQLFRFSAVSGHRYVFRTDGATNRPLKAEVYDASGRVVAASGDSVSDSDQNLQFAYSATETGVLYFGIAENLPPGVVPAHSEIGVLLTDVTELPADDDEFDPTDDEFAGATLLSPVLVGDENASPAAVDMRDLPQHTLSLTDWRDIFRIQAERAGVQYRFELETADGAVPANGIKAEVYRLADQVPVPVPTIGSLAMDPEGRTVLKLNVSDPDDYYIVLSSAVGESVAYPPYRIHSCMYVAQDEWDSADDKMAGATELTSSPQPIKSALHTLWDRDRDPADWFVLAVEAGKSYRVSFADKTGDVLMSLYDESGEEILGPSESIYHSPVENGTCYVKVAHPPSGLAVNSTYCLLAQSVSVGTLSLVTTSVRSAEDAVSVKVKVTRTTNEGDVCVRWGTIGDTAKPGVDYFADQGILNFQNGGSLSQEISIRLIPDLMPVEEGEKQFYVRIENVRPDELKPQQYPIGIKGPNTAVITLTDAGVPVVPPSPDPAGLDDDTSLMVGTFSGCLLENDGYFRTDALQSVAQFELQSKINGLSAEVKIGDAVYSFVGSPFTMSLAGYYVGELRSECTIGSRTYASLLTISVPAGSTAGFDTTLPARGFAELRLVMPSPDGISADEVHYEGTVFRLENAEYTSIRSRLRDHIGCYTMALVGADLGYSCFGDGGLSFELKIDGTVTGSGFLPNGDEFEFASIAGLFKEGGIDYVGIPLNVKVGNAAIGGLLCLVEDVQGKWVCLDAFDMDGLMFFDDGAKDAFDWSYQGGLYAYGGEFDVNSNLVAYFSDRDLIVEADGLDAQISNGALQSANLDVSIDRASGRIAGTYSDAGCKGVLVLSGDTDCQWLSAGSVVFGVVGQGAETECLRVLSVSTSRSEAEDYGFKSTIRFDGNGNDSGSAPADIVALVGDMIPLPEPMTNRNFGAGYFGKTGYRFCGWLSSEGVLMQPGQDCLVLATDTSFKAKWELSADGIAEALVETGLFKFMSSGAEAWFPQSAVVRPGGPIHAVQSGAVSVGEESVLSATVQGPGRLSFWWRSEFKSVFSFDSDEVRFSVNGVKVAQIKDVTSWQKVTDIVLPSGEVEISWTYSHANGYAEEGGAAWLSELRLDPLYEVTFDPNGGTVPETVRIRAEGDEIGELPVPVRNGWKYEGWTNALGASVAAETHVPAGGLSLFAKWSPVPVMISFDGNGNDGGSVPDPLPSFPGETIDLPAQGSLAKTDCRFLGWMGPSGKIYAANESYPVTGNETLRAMWADTNIQTALDTDLGVVSTAFGVGSDAQAEGGKCVRSQASPATVTVQVTGAGVVSFRWLLAKTVDMFGGDTNDRFEFYVDNELVDSLSDTTAWKDAEHEIQDQGDHLLSWKFTADTLSGFVGEQGHGSLDSIGWEPIAVGKKITITFDPNGGTCAETSREVVTNSVLKNLPAPERSGFAFAGWFDEKGVEVRENSRVGEEDVTLVAHWGAVATVTFASGGAEGQIPSRMVAVGSPLVLPGVDGELVLANHVFAGWSDGRSVYQAGDECMISADTEFTAQWRDARYCLPLDCLELDFASSDDSAWTQVGGEGNSYLATTKTGDGAKADLTAVAAEDGLVSFSWGLTRADDMLYGTLDDKIEFYVDDVLKATLSANCSWTVSPEFAVAKNQKMTWRFVGHATSMFLTSEAEARLDAVKWVSAGPKTANVSVSWQGSALSDAHLKSVSLIVGNQTNQIVESGASFEVEVGVQVKLVAVADAWYVAAGGGIYLVNEVMDLPLTARKVSVEDDILGERSIAEVKSLLGLETDLFDGITEGETRSNLARVTSWAMSAGYSPQDVCGMSFDSQGNPSGDLEAAYLLNTTIDGVSTAAADFKFTAFDGSLESLRIGMTAVKAGDRYGNGKVLVRSYADVSCTEEVSSEGRDKVFFKAFLVK